MIFDLRFTIYDLRLEWSFYVFVFFKKERGWNFRFWIEIKGSRE